jgi:hypothetical protein
MHTSTSSRCLAVPAAPPRLLLPLLSATLLLGASETARAQCSPGNVYPQVTNVMPPNSRYGVTIADFDNDGSGDIAAANASFGTIHVLRGIEGQQALNTYFTSAAGPFDVESADFDEDGILDLVVTTFSGNIDLFLGDGFPSAPPGTFTLVNSMAAGGSPRHVAVDDFNDDGILDLAVTLYSGGYSILLGLGSGGVGNGTFAPFVRYDNDWGGFGIATGDFNSDGVTDIATANFSTVRVHRGKAVGGFGDGTFLPGTSLSVYTTVLSVRTADVNTDGILDLVSAGYTGVANEGRISVLIGGGSQGMGTGTFEPALHYRAGHIPYEIVVADVDLDGKVDVVAADQLMAEATVIPGLGGGGFGLPIAINIGTAAFGIVAGRINADPFPELAVATAGGPVKVLFNICPDLLIPVITGLSPSAGPVGASVTIEGTGLQLVTSVAFNGVAAPILSQITTAIETMVPTGATSGPVTVTWSGGTVSSPTDFVVGTAPTITSFDPPTGKFGTSVAIEGASFTTASKLRFGPSSDAAFTIDSDTRITAVVDSHAVTGPVTVTNLFGTSVSTIEFTVIPPETSARIVSVKDVPNDEGGRVFVNWLRSDFDVAGFRSITGYRVWRRSNAAAPLDPARALRTYAASTAEAEAYVAAPGRPRASDTEFWEPIADIPAARLEGYSFMASTSQDSMQGSNPYTAFFVQTLTTDPFTYFHSAVDSGYSVDNLAPDRPRSLVGAFETSGVTLRWLPAQEPDIGSYRVYRGASADFTPSGSTLLADQADTVFFDRDGTVAHVYKVSAVDVHGNESGFAALSALGASLGLAAVGAVAAESDHVRLEWSVKLPAGLPVTVSRRTEADDWAAVGPALIADGKASYIDRDVLPGTRYAYRLSLNVGDTEITAGEVWVHTTSLALALAGIYPNPGDGRTLNVRFTLPTRSDARLELIDVSGRLQARHDLASLPAGRHDVDVARGITLAPGVYVVRLVNGAAVLSKRAVVVR